MAKRRNKDWHPQRYGKSTINLMVIKSPEGEPVAYVDTDTMVVTWVGALTDCTFCDQMTHHFHNDDRYCPLCGTDDLLTCWRLNGKAP